MIFNLRGTNGTGKSTVAHLLISKAKATPVAFWPNTRQPKPKAYVGSWKGVPIVILGSYATVCGGMDTITDINDARDLIVQYGTDSNYPIMFYEGLFISHMMGTVATGIERAGLKDRLVMGYLDTPLATAIERVKKRRIEKGNLVPFDPANVVRDFRAVHLNYAKAKREGWNVVDINHANAQAHVESYLNKAAKAAKKGA